MLLVGCGAEPPGEVVERPTQATAMVWRELGTWSGEGDRQTESFDVATGALRLVWTVDEGAPEPAALRVTLHSAISGRPLETIVDGVGVGSDSVRFAATPRVAYLLIEAEAIDWHLRLAEGVASPATGPSPPE